MKIIYYKSNGVLDILELLMVTIAFLLTVTMIHKHLLNGCIQEVHLDISHIRIHICISILIHLSIVNGFDINSRNCVAQLLVC